MENMGSPKDSSVTCGEVQVGLRREEGDMLTRLSRQRDISKVGMMTRVYRWFINLPWDAQRVILFPPDNASQVQVIEALLAHLRAAATGGEAPSDLETAVGEALDDAVQEHKAPPVRQTRKRA